ncbi:hypothetical protein BH10PSE18_BH10PSE18_28390 [soil metagenome]
MNAFYRILYVFMLALAAGTLSAAELEMDGDRLVVSGTLDGSAAEAFAAHLTSGKVRVVRFHDSFGGTLAAAESYAAAIHSSGVQTEVTGQCHAACAYAFLAGKDRRFGRGAQVNGLLIPVPTRPRPEELGTRWRDDGGQKTLAEFNPGGPTAAAPAAPQKDLWQAEQGVLFTSLPTLFGRVYNAYYCDGTQGRDLSRCEILTDADPYKLGVLTP